MYISLGKHIKSHFTHICQSAVTGEIILVRPVLCVFVVKNVPDYYYVEYASMDDEGNVFYGKEISEKRYKALKFTGVGVI